MSAPQDAMEPIRELIQGQSWYKKVAPAISTGVGAIVGLVWFGSSVGLQIPDEAQKWGFVVIALLTVVGVYQTPRGITGGQLQDLENQYAGRHRKL